MHALNAEHAQSVLCLFADAYWVGRYGYDHYCVGAQGFGKSLF